MLDTFLTSLTSSYHMWVIFAIIVCVIYLYVTEKLPLEVTSILTLSTLLFFFHFFPLRENGQILLEPETLLSGFANPALIAIMCLLVIGQAVVRTGALNELVELILKFSNNRAWLSIGLTLAIVMVVSSVLNNTPVVVIFIPILSELAKRLQLPVSRVMIPLSYVAILGGMTTLIGTSTNILIAGEVEKFGMERLGFFDFTLPGSILAAVGFLYVLLIAPKFLPDRTGLASELAGEDRQFIAQIEVDPSSDLIGQPVETKGFMGIEEMELRIIQRGEHAYLPPYDENFVLRPGDIIIVAAPRAAISELLQKHPNALMSQLQGFTEEGEDKQPKTLEDVSLAEVVVAPASRMIGLNLEQIGFRYHYHCTVLGIQRGSKVIRTRLTEIRLAAGDVLLVLGNKQDVQALRDSRDVLFMELSTEDLHARHYAHRAVAIFASVVLLAALNIIPIHISAFIGATATVLLGCLNIRQAVRSLDRQIYLLIVASQALSISLDATGGAHFIAESLVSMTPSENPLVIMTVMFLLISLMTEVISNNASALLFTPIAMNVALTLDMDPTMFIFAVVFASSCAFSSPIGYQTHLLVMAPGHYKFTDYMRTGVALNLLLTVTYASFAWWYFG